MIILRFIVVLIAFLIICCCVLGKRADEWLKENENKGDENNGI